MPEYKRVGEGKQELSRPYEWEFIQAVDQCRKLYVQSRSNPEYAYMFYASVKMLRLLLPRQLRSRVPELPEKIPVKGEGHIAKTKYKIMMMRRIAFQTFQKILDTAYSAGLITEVQGFVGGDGD